MDLRGAGDLFGKEQAGHLKSLGPALYRHLLDRALASHDGHTGEDWSPEVNLDVPGLIPADYVSEEEVRINLYYRLSRLRSMAAVEDFADELDDRYGPLPPAMQALLARANLREACRRAEVSRVDAGPEALALRFRSVSPLRLRDLLEEDPALSWRGDRLVYSRATAPEQRANAALELLERIAG